MDKIRIIYFGTPEFASSQLEAIITAGYEVAAVVTIPDKAAGRGMAIRFSEVKKSAMRHGLPLLQPQSLKDPGFLNELRSFNANLFIVVAFRMLPVVVWKMPALGTFNLHASLLPQYRGAAPINHVIINGETETGLTTFFLNEEIDKGAVIMQQKVMIRPDETTGELHDELMTMGNRIIVDTIRKIEQGEATPINQEMLVNSERLKEAPKISKDFCNVKWNEDGKTIYNLIRGLSPYPAAYTQIISDAGTVMDLKIFASEIEICKPIENMGDIVTDGKSFLKVTLRDGYLLLTNVQLSGKKKMDIKDFLRGQHLEGHWRVANI